MHAHTAGATSASLLSLMSTCMLYEKVARVYTSCWRKADCNISLSTSVEEDDKYDDGDEARLERINVIEWAELLIINGALDVDYI